MWWHNTRSTLANCSARHTQLARSDSPPVLCLAACFAERVGAALPFVLIGSVLIASGPVFSLLPETKPPSAPAAAASNGGARLGALSSAVDSFRVLLKDERQVALCFMTFTSLLAGRSH